MLRRPARRAEVYKDKVHDEVQGNIRPAHQQDLPRHYGSAHLSEPMSHFLAFANFRTTSAAVAKLMRPGQFRT